ncbi:STAS domain-containing protein [Caryophanon latum]|uniref:Anti-sigma factor antagonist n=1 Tax=Caryophanon latum TaxID=33977 RepID=A0A1C0Z0W0_9BACL|nr:STAS domain-containing protein [Caryophanon latum]OCS93059.1 anti-anti-sigma factor [Caryophanon latum]
MNYVEASVAVHAKTQYTVIEFSGHLEYGKIEDIKRILQETAFQHERNYIIDMQKVTNVDSTGFGMIVNFAKKVSMRGQQIAIIVVDEFVRNLFAISQCDKIFPLVKSEAEGAQIMIDGWQSEISLSEY